MVFREVDVLEVKEMLRLWVRGHGYKTIARLSQIDRKTVRRYVEAALDAGLRREAGESQITDALMGEVINAVRPARPGSHGRAWEHLDAQREFIKARLKEGLTLTKIATLLFRHTGEVVPYRTFHRFCVGELGYRPGRATTVRVDDPEPGTECQIDFGRMGFLFDPASGRRRLVYALIFTACYSRHLFVFLTYSQTLASLIEGCEAAWSFFGGVFKVLILDYVPRNIIEVLFPGALCAPEAARRQPPRPPGGERLGATDFGHITLRGMPATSAASRRSAKQAWCGMPPKNPAAGWLQGLPTWSWC